MKDTKDNKDNDKVIFHIDVNSAFLSWEAVKRLQNGESLDLRTIPSVVGGDPFSRQGIVLAKSIPAKKYGVKTGEPIFKAKQKCPKLVIVQPNHDLYMRCSADMEMILKKYTPDIEKFSIDEYFLGFYNMEYLYSDYLRLAYIIKNRIKSELGFTVNIGVSSSKVLAKIAGDFTKPDKVHTLFPSEVQEKMWPLPIQKLYMVGESTVHKLNKLNIFTIGDLAQYDFNIIKDQLKGHGVTIWQYANGIDNSKIKNSEDIDVKSIGKSITTEVDIKDRETAYKILLYLCEIVADRLRNNKRYCKLVSVNIKTNNFVSYSKQKKLYHCTDCTFDIYDEAGNLFDIMWKGEPIRQIGVTASDLSENKSCQVTFFDAEMKKSKSIDKVVDEIRMKYGSDAIVKATFLNRDS